MARRRWLVLWSALALALPAAAQIPSAIDVDSLRALLPAARGQGRLDILNLIATHDGEFATDRGLALARQVLAEARQAGYGRGEARALENIGQALYFQGHYAAALDTLQLACARLEAAGETRLSGYCRLKLANVLNMQHRRDAAVAEIGAAIERLQQAGDGQGVGHAWNNLGWLYWRVGAYQEAIDAYGQARVLRERYGQRRYLAATLNNMGIIHYQWGRYAEALEDYLASLAIRRELGDARGQALVNNNIGKIYQDWGDGERARGFFADALALSAGPGDGSARGYSLHNLGTVDEKAGRLQEALERYAQSLAAYGETGDSGGVTLNETALARVHNARGEFDAALTILARALARARRAENRELEAQILLQTGIAERGLGRPERSLAALRESLRRATEMDTRDLMKDVHLELSTTLGASGRPAEALAHLRQHNALRDSLFATRFGQQLADMQTRYETEQLRRDALEQEGRIRAQEQRSLLVSGLLVAVFLLALALGAGIHQKQRAHDALRHEMDVRTEAEVALRRREETFRTLTDNLPVGVCRIEVDPRFQMVEANPEMVRMFDFASREEMLAASTQEIFGTPRERFALFRQIVAGRPIATVELTVVTRAGRRFVGALSASAPLTAADGTRFVDGIIEDVTERHEFEAALRAARDAAESANRAKTAFLANMSHEIRTPLNAILGYAQILRADRALTAAQRRAVETVERSGNHLLALINDVLDVSKIEAGFQELNPVAFDLADLVDDLARMFALRCREKGLRWDVAADLPVRVVRGDEVKLRQVLINLLGNAVKFSDTGSVGLRVIAAADGLHRFVVTDTGRGIAAEHQHSIFEPFHQEGAPASGGTGLGLAIAREHVRLMGGNLQLESRAGEGSTFSFTVPLPAAAGDAPAAADDGHDYDRVVRLAPGQSARILVVDDVAENREVLERMLQVVGIDVAAAADGDEGLRLALDGRFDLVFADIRMPTMGGDELRRRLVAALGASAPKAVAVTASALSHQRRQLLDEGFDAFIDKPFRAAQIYACLADLLGLRYEFDAPPAAGDGPPDLVGIRLEPQARDGLAEALRTHNITLLRQVLRRLDAAGGRQRELAAYLTEMSGGYDIRVLRGWWEAHAPELEEDAT